MQSDYALQYENLWRHHWWLQSRKQFVLARLRRLHARRPLKNILDIGCGNGLFFDDLARFGAVQGLESDPLIVHDGPHRAQIQVRIFDDTYMPPQPLDLVLMLDVLEHIQDHRAAARHVRRILAPGGAFLLTVPALMSLWSAHDVVNRHFRRYTKHTLHAVLTEAGFRIRALHYFFGWTVAPMLLRRVLSPGAGPAAPDAPGEYHVRIPPPPVNLGLYALSRLEQISLGSLLPLGSSLLAIATPEQNP
jgi:SAM-dependent methyltransferase